MKLFIIQLICIFALIGCDQQSSEADQSKSDKMMDKDMMSDGSDMQDDMQDGMKDHMMDDKMSTDMMSDKDYTNDLGYAFGVFMVQQGGILDLVQFVDQESLVQGIQDALNNQVTVDQEVMANQIQEFVAQQQAEQETNNNMTLADLKQQQASNLAASKTLLDEKRQEEGVLALPSGTLVQITQAADGEVPSANATVSVHYTGTFINGTVFDSSRSRGEPAAFPLNGVIVGFKEGIGSMKVGERAMLYIPAEAGYGLLTGNDEQDLIAIQANQYAVIGPGNTLIFDVELLDIVDSSN